MRSMGPLMLVGLAGFATFKMGGILIPVLVILFGLMGLVVKLAIMCAIGYFVLSLIRSFRRRRDEI